MATPRRGFTLIELMVTLMLLLIVSGTAAIGLTSRLPNLKLRAQATQLLGTLASSRELALTEKRSRKVRFHQTRRAADVAALFKQDDALDYGTHQLMFASPVYVWFETEPAQQAIATRTFPPVTLNRDDYDVGAPGTIVVRPILNPFDMQALPPDECQFPRAMASLRMPGSVELDPLVRIVAVNGRPTYGAAASTYAVSPYENPIPANPVPLTGIPPRPASGTYATHDDRIADVTYSPDGVFRCTPRVTSASGDFTLTLATEPGAQTLQEPDAITITIDRRTGIPRF